MGGLRLPAHDLRGLGLALLLALGLLLLLSAPAVADGLIVDRRTVGAAGLQKDAAELSPAPSPSAASARAATTYRVAPGDTLGVIAEKFGLTADALAATNGITDPNLIREGQVLVVGAAPSPVPSLPSDGPVARLQLWPWPPAQGQTLVVRFHAGGPVGTAFSATLTYEGRPYLIETAAAGGWALVPVPPLTEPGDKPLVLDVAGQRLYVHIPVVAGSFPSHNIPASTTDAILTDAGKVRAETQRMVELFSGRTDGPWRPNSRFAPPLEGDHPHTAPYGSRRTYGNNPAISAHAGEDYSAAPGTPVYAPAAGTVVLAETLFVRGNAVVLDHGHGVYTGYWHMSELSVKVGDQVIVGQELGKVGSTGLSTGAHLHWELQVNGLPVDPLQWRK